jgi:hypothetical protein
VVDHVKKDRETRGRWATGTGQKLAKVDVQYALEQDHDAPFGQGLKGRIAVWLYKDKPGSLRRSAKNRYFGRLYLDNASDESRVDYWIEPPRDEDAVDLNAERLMALFEDENTINSRNERACDGAWMTLADIRQADGMDELDGADRTNYDQTNRRLLKKLAGGAHPRLNADVRNGVTARWQLAPIVGAA